MTVSQCNPDLISCMTLQSPAKINVFLEILGKRPDGFHELETVMLRTAFSDQLHFQVLPRPEIRLSLAAGSVPASASGFPLDDTNLIIRAAKSLQERTGSCFGAEICVQKRIPAAAGLAGGSSNAATTLLALNQLWKTQLPPADLHSIAAVHGSDINFLLSGARAAVCRGRGEIIEPISVASRLYFVAVRPHRGNSTGEVFRRTVFCNQPRSSASVVACLKSHSPKALSQHCFNRLTEAACESNPEMSELLSWIPGRLGRPAFMSGSGSTCFVIAENHRDACRQRAILESCTRFPVWVLEC